MREQKKNILFSSFYSHTSVEVTGSSSLGMDKKKLDKKKLEYPLICPGHSRPVVDLFYSRVTPDGCFLISASKGMFSLFKSYHFGFEIWFSEIILVGCSCFVCYEY